MLLCESFVTAVTHHDGSKRNFVTNRDKGLLLYVMLLYRHVFALVLIYFEREG